MMRPNQLPEYQRAIVAAFKERDWRVKRWGQGTDIRHVALIPPKDSGWRGNLLTVNLYLCRYWELQPNDLCELDYVCNGPDCDEKWEEKIDTENDKVTFNEYCYGEAEDVENRVIEMMKDK